MWKWYVDGVVPVSRGEEHSVRDDPGSVRTNRLATRFLATTSLWESGDLRHKTGSWLVICVSVAGKSSRSQFPIQIMSSEVLSSASLRSKVKVKCTLLQALKLCTGRTAHRGSRGIALLLHDHGTRSGWGVSVTPRPLFTPGKDPVPIVQDAVWAPGPDWTSAENLAPTGIRSQDRPAHSQSLYRLSYPAHSLRSE